MKSNQKKSDLLRLPPRQTPKERIEDIIASTYIIDAYDGDITYRRPHDVYELMQDNAYTIDSYCDGRSGLNHTKFKSVIDRETFAKWSEHIQAYLNRQY